MEKKPGAGDVWTATKRARQKMREVRAEERAEATSSAPDETSPGPKAYDSPGITARERSAVRIGLVLAVVIGFYVALLKPALQEERQRGQEADCIIYQEC